MCSFLPFQATGLSVSLVPAKIWFENITKPEITCGMFLVLGVWKRKGKKEDEMREGVCA